MSKILLIEDQLERQNNFMSFLDFSLTDYKEVLNNAILENYQTISKELKDDIFNFDEYDIIIVHKSAFENEVRTVISKLEHFCKETKKSLVLFGGDASSYYNNNEYEHLQINSKFFYSENLKLFLDDYIEGNKNLLILSFGKKWQLNIVLNVVEKINFFLEKNNDEDIVYQEFRNETDINQLDNIEYSFYKVDVDEDNWVYREEIIKLKNSIDTYIEEYIDNE